MTKPNKFSGMMQEYCVGKGFCGSIVDGDPCHIRDFIPKTGEVSADQFVTWLLQAENMEPKYSSWRTELVKVFIKHMGSYSVDASMLR